MVPPGEEVSRASDGASDFEERAVVTVFLRSGPDVLLLRRSEAVGSYAGRWGAVAGHAEGAPDALAREEIAEETGLLEAASLVRRGDSFVVVDQDAGIRWRVHPYLFDCASRDVTPNEETTEWAWVSPVEIFDRNTVPDLWTSYSCVAPDVATVRDDREHGSAYLSYRALEVLRDSAAALAAGRDDPAGGDLERLASDLLAARETMAVLANRVHRAMARTDGERSPVAVRDAAAETLREAVDADAAAADQAADQIRAAGGRVLTLSRSGTVLDALRAGADDVVVCESRPAREGVGVAEALATDCEVTLVIDAAAAHVLSAGHVDAVLVGADAVLPDGQVVNKVGTRGVATAAAKEDVPTFVVCAGDKVRVVDCVDLDRGPASEVYGGDAAVSVDNPTFDLTPTDLATIITEDGQLDDDERCWLVEAHRENRGWRDA